MNKNEFCDLAGVNFESLSDNDYKKIEYVYMYHPAVESKKDIAQCYKMTHGMMMIEMMIPVAKIQEQAEEYRNHYRNLMQKSEIAMDLLKQGDIDGAKAILDNMY